MCIIHPDTHSNPHLARHSLAPLIFGFSLGLVGNHSLYILYCGSDMKEAPVWHAVTKVEMGLRCEPGVISDGLQARGLALCQIEGIPVKLQTNTPIRLTAYLPSQAS